MHNLSHAQPSRGFYGCRYSAKGCWKYNRCFGLNGSGYRMEDFRFLPPYANQENGYWTFKCRTIIILLKCWWLMVVPERCFMLVLWMIQMYRFWWFEISDIVIFIFVSEEQLDFNQWVWHICFEIIRPFLKINTAWHHSISDSLESWDSPIVNLNSNSNGYFMYSKSR